MKPLAIVPVYVRNDNEMAVTAKAIQTLYATADCDIMVVDDCSPDRENAALIREGVANLGGLWVGNKENSGFSRTVNVGLREALDRGSDAILVNADIEFRWQGWMEALQSTPAYVSGAQLLYPNGLIQHAGIYFSVLGRDFTHIYAGCPPDLVQVRRRRRCPVTGALQYIRSECLQLVGIYDEDYRMGFEDVDYCIRVFKAGRDCVYVPEAVAVHHESVFRGTDPSQKVLDWQRDSKKTLLTKHAGVNFSEYLPTMLQEGEGWL